MFDYHDYITLVFIASDTYSEHLPFTDQLGRLKVKIYVVLLTSKALNQIIWILTHLKLCLATATHNFKWVEITHICLIWDHTFANFDA